MPNGPGNGYCRQRTQPLNCLVASAGLRAKAEHELYANGKDLLVVFDLGLGSAPQDERPMRLLTYRVTPHPAGLQPISHASRGVCRPHVGTSGVTSTSSPPSDLRRLSARHSNMSPHSTQSRRTSKQRHRSTAALGFPKAISQSPSLRTALTIHWQKIRTNNSVIVKEDPQPASSLSEQCGRRNATRTCDYLLAVPI
jgi:hypothetical protein